MKQMMRVAAVGIAVLVALSAFGEPYIETDGSQYVNTGYFVNPKTRVEMDYALLDTTRAQQRMFGTGGQDITSSTTSTAASAMRSRSRRRAWATRGGPSRHQDNAM